MNKVYLHYKRNISLLNIIILLLFLFSIYGFYKNGIVLYSSGYTNLLMMFKPLYMLLISLGTSFLFSKIYKEKFVSFRLAGNLMITLCAMYNINLLVYLILILVVNGINKFIKFNVTGLFMVISIVLNMFLKNNTFANIMENSNIFNYSFLDYLLGKGVGGVGNTLLILSLISYGILTCNNEYKKQIPTVFLITFYVLITIKSFITGNADVNLFINNNVIFGAIFMLPLSVYSPYFRGSIYVYGVLMAILTFLLSFIDINLAIYLVIFIGSVIYKFFDKILVK